MELDTWAGVSLVSEKTLQMILPSQTTHATRTQLRTYSEEAVPVVGKVAWKCETSRRSVIHKT